MVFDANAICWYAVRVSYGRVLKFSAGLESAGIEHFVPMCVKKVERDGKKVSVIVPAVSNLCFVHSSKSLIDEYFISLGEARNAHFIWDKATRNPIVVNDKSMQDFMQISRVMSDDILYLKDVADKLRAGQKVRVIDGPFKGVKGTVLRVKRSRRVVVDFPGLLAIATTYIDPRDLQVI